MKILALLACLSCLCAQTHSAGTTKILGSTQVSAAQPAPFNILTLTSKGFSPSVALLSPSGCSGATCFPVIAGTSNPQQGYQGGQYFPPSASYPNGVVIFMPWQQGINAVPTPHGTVLAYVGGPAGNFHCTTAIACASVWDWFDMTTLTAACPTAPTYPCPTGANADSATGFTCQGVTDSSGNVYFVPGADQQNPTFVMLAPFGANGSGFGGTPISNPANYTAFQAPTANPASPIGYKYGWCTSSYDGRYVYYAPTAGGAAFQNSNLLRYDTTAPFAPAAFTSLNLSTAGIPGTTNNCCYLSSVYDGGTSGGQGRYVYLLPTSVAPGIGALITRYDTQGSGGFSASSSYAVLNLGTLGNAGHPAVTGVGSLGMIQSQAGYVGGQMAWNAAGTVEYMYMAPFAGTNGGAGGANKQVLSDVLRVQVGTCSPGIANTQSCTGTFTALDITSNVSSTWEMFDLANLVANPAWVAAGFTNPPLYPAGNPLANQLNLGGFQLTWLNVHNTADPIVGFVTDFGNFYVRHHVNGAFSDPSSWDVGARPPGQQNGCMGGGYDPVNQILYTACPAPSSVAPSAWMISNL